MNNSLITTAKSCTACIFTVNSSAPAAQRRSQVKWLTPVKPEKNACLASTLFQCSLLRSDAVDHKATPPPPMKNARCAAAAGHKTTQRRRRPPVRQRTALRRTSRFWISGGITTRCFILFNKITLISGFVLLLVNDVYKCGKKRHNFCYCRDAMFVFVKKRSICFLLTFAIAF